MNEKTNYGKIIAITLAVITSACAIAFVIYRLFRNLIEFCNTSTVPKKQAEDLELCETEELCEEPAEEEAAAEEAVAEETATEE